MALQIKSLYKNALGSSEADTYVVPINKAAIVKSIRLVNTSGSASATVNLFAKRGSGTSYRIAPLNLILAPGAAFIDNEELTLEGLTSSGDSDRITGSATGATVHCVISGVERDV